MMLSQPVVFLRLLLAEALFRLASWIADLATRCLVPGHVRQPLNRAHVALAKLAMAYGFFALVAAGVNLGAQWIVLKCAEVEFGPHLRWSALPALACGTGAGLAVKYWLDKRFIFRDAASGAKAHAKKFTLYAFMGLGTTAIFWATELVFGWLSPGTGMIYVGGALGLLIGYVIKYRLDRRFVFNQAVVQAER